MTDDSLISSKQPDGFTSESPIRAFTDFQVSGTVAIGKGFRPSLAHLSRYLDAMETREGWRLVQIILAVNDEGDPTIIFHKLPRLLMAVTDKTTGMFGEPYVPSAAGPVVPDLGAPHDTALNVKVKSNFGMTHEASAAYTKDAWWFITHMSGDAIDATERMRGFPDAWRRPGEESWHGIVEGKRDADDPVNPKHYGGTACAEIGERLSGNSYQVLKYNWRLGGKDDEKIEIGKAIWYLDREMELAREGWRPIVLEKRTDTHLRKLLADQPEWTRLVATRLMSWNTYGNIETLRGLRKMLLAHKSMTDDGVTTGLAV